MSRSEEPTRSTSIIHGRRTQMEKEAQSNHLLDVNQAAELLGLKVSIIRKLTMQGALPVVRPTGRRAVRCARRDLDDLIRLRSQPIRPVGTASSRGPGKERTCAGPSGSP